MELRKHNSDYFSKKSLEYMKSLENLLIDKILVQIDKLSDSGFRTFNFPVYSEIDGNVYLIEEKCINIAKKDSELFQIGKYLYKLEPKNIINIIEYFNEKKFKTNFEEFSIIETFSINWN